MAPKRTVKLGRRSAPVSRATSSERDEPISDYVDPMEDSATAGKNAASPRGVSAAATQPYSFNDLKLSALAKLIPRPDKFTGQNGTHVVYLFVYALTNYFALVATANNISEFPEHTKIAFTGSFLAGYALLWFRAHARLYPTHKALCDAMLKQFGEINMASTCRTKIENLKQVGPVVTYIASFTELGLMLSATGDDYLSTDEAHHAFTRGLNSDIRIAVAMAQKGSNDCREAMTLAAEYESAKRSTAPMGEQNRFYNNNNTQRRYQYPHNGRVNNVMLNNAPPPPPPRRVSFAAEPMKCFNCGELNHIARNCPNPPKNWRRAAKK